MARLSIGEFANASGLTPKALRLYDELALLSPAEVDARSGYRWYEPHQLERALLVLRLRGLGMPLARIRTVCDLPPRAVAAEVLSYWRQVEADTAARKDRAAFLIDQLSGEDTDRVEKHASVQLSHACQTDRGLVRETNEDAVYAGTHLVAVADGFQAPGLERAASEAAIEALAALDAEVPPTQDLLQTLDRGVYGARQAVHEFARSDSTRENSGSALTAMLWSGAQFAVAHVGDARAYLLREGELVQLTHDHTWVQSLVDEGRMTADEAAAHPRRADLSRALHHSDTSKPDLHLREARAGDRYLLCTDGMHAVLAERDLHQVLAVAATPQQAVRECGERVYEAGAPDNFCCLVTDVAAPA